MPRKYAGPLQPGKRSAYVKGTRKNKVTVVVKPARRRNKRTRRNVLFNRGPSLIPDSYITKMRYTQQYSNASALTLQAGVVGPETRFAILAANSVFDPDDGSILGSFPVGYEEMRRLYRRFYVSGCSIRAELMVTGGDLASGYKMIIIPTNRNSVNNISYDALRSNPYCTKSKYVGPAFGKNIITLNHRMSTQSITGRKKPSIESDYHGELSALSNGDPVTQWWFLVVIQSINPNFEEDNIRLNVELTYNVMFYDRRQQDQPNFQEVDSLLLDEDTPNTIPPGNSGDNPGNGPP